MKIMVNHKDVLYCELCGAPGCVHLSDEGLISCEDHDDLHLKVRQFDAETGRPVRVLVSAA